MSESVKQNVFYQCPNNCPDTWFFQFGTVPVTRRLTEDGGVMEDDLFDFDPNTPVKCYKCEAEAVVKTKTVRVITTIE